MSMTMPFPGTRPIVSSPPASENVPSALSPRYRTTSGMGPLKAVRGAAGGASAGGVGGVGGPCVLMVRVRGVIASTEGFATSGRLSSTIGGGSGSGATTGGAAGGGAEGAAVSSVRGSSDAISRSSGASASSSRTLAATRRKTSARWPCVSGVTSVASPAGLTRVSSYTSTVNPLAWVPA